MRARLGERARDGAQLVAGFLGGLLLRLKLQDKQTSLPHMKSGYPATNCFTRDPGAGKAQHQHQAWKSHFLGHYSLLGLGYASSIGFQS